MIRINVWPFFCNLLLNLTTLALVYICTLFEDILAPYLFIFKITLYLIF